MRQVAHQWKYQRCSNAIDAVNQGHKIQQLNSNLHMYLTLGNISLQLSVNTSCL